MVTEKQIIELAEELNKVADAQYETSAAIENLNNGDYYGDKLADSIADIAKSLRILSGREELK